MASGRIRRSARRGLAGAVLAWVGVATASVLMAPSAAAAPTATVEIKKQVEGIYAIVDIEAEPAAVAELDRQLNLNESVLRTKLMRPEVH